MNRYPGFRLNYATLVSQVCAILVDGRRRNPHLPDCDPILALVLGGVTQLKECGRPAEVVGVQVSERNNIVRIPPRALQVSAQGLLKIDTLVRGVAGIPRIGVVDQNLLASSQIDTATVRVAKRKQGDGMHRPLNRTASTGRSGRKHLVPAWRHHDAPSAHTQSSCQCRSIDRRRCVGNYGEFLSEIAGPRLVGSLSASVEITRSPIARSLPVSQSPTTTFSVRV